jgi:hypothetical protein
MISKSMSAEARVRAVTRAILVVGFVSAVVIYFVAATQPETPGFEFENSKKYLRELEVYGGKANVLATEFRHWFDGLWHGRSLAFTVAVISVVLALVYRFFATPLPPADGRNADSGEN